ncbi:MAG: FliH/SctL family protein [Xanthobacteraceae bacterium]
MRAAPAKFLFENDFAKGGGDRTPSIPNVEHQAKLKEVESAAHARGVEEGKAAAKADADARAAATLERIAKAIEGLDKNLKAVETRLEIEAVEVAVAVAGKLAPELVAREPFAEIAALATDCFRHLVAAPHVAVRVNDAQHEMAREKLEEVARRCGLESRLVVLAEPEIAPGDCRIEWADGGINRDAEAIAAVIGQAVARYVNALRTDTGGAALPDIPWRSNT